MKESKWGFIDKSGKFVIKPQYNFARGFSEGLAYVYNPSEKSYINKDGTIVIPLNYGSDYDGFFGFHEDMAMFRFRDPEDNCPQYVFMDKKGRIISKQYDGAENFQEGIAKVYKNKRCIDNYLHKIIYDYTFIDKSGKEITGVSFKEANSFREGLALVEFRGKKGFINNLGLFSIDPKFYDAGDFYEGKAKVILNSDEDKWGYIDKTGCLIIKQQFSDCGDFHEGMAKVKINKKWGYIDSTGKMIISPLFNEAGDFYEGLAKVKIKNKWGYIDVYGNIIIPIEFNEAEDFHEGLAKVERENGLGEFFSWGEYIDRKGNTILSIDQIDSHLYLFREGLATARFNSNNKVGFIDKSGNCIIEPRFDDAKYFHEGYAQIKIGTKWGYINTSGEIVIKPQFDDADSFFEGLAGIKIDNKWGFVDTKGTIVIHPQFERINEGFDKSNAEVVYLGNPCVIDKIGRIIHDGYSSHSHSPYTDVEVIFINQEGVTSYGYEDCYDIHFEEFHEGMARFWIENEYDDFERRYGFIDKSGTVISPRFIDALDFNEGLAAVETENIKNNTTTIEGKNTENSGCMGIIMLLLAFGATLMLI